MEAPLSQPLMAASDPFYAVRDALEAEVTGVKIKHDHWKATLHSTNSASDAKFRVLHEQHKRDLAKAGELCRKVRMAVENVEQNRGKFAHIDDRELGQRKGFCDRVDASVAAMKADYGSRETQGKLESDQRKELAGRMQSDRENAARANSAYTKGNSNFLAEQGQAQATIRREQDQSLDKLSGGLDMLKEMGTAIHDELQTQEKMAEDIEKKIDENQNKASGWAARVPHPRPRPRPHPCRLRTAFVTNSRTQYLSPRNPAVRHGHGGHREAGRHQGPVPARHDLHPRRRVSSCACARNARTECRPPPLAARWSLPAPARGALAPLTMPSSARRRAASSSSQRSPSRRRLRAQHRHLPLLVLVRRR